MTAEFVSVHDEAARLRKEAAGHEHAASVAWGAYGAALAKADRCREVAQIEEAHSLEDTRTATELVTFAGDAIEEDR
jgi:hypothetical protein